MFVMGRGIEPRGHEVADYMDQETPGLGSRCCLLYGLSLPGLHDQLCGCDASGFSFTDAELETIAAELGRLLYKFGQYDLLRECQVAMDKKRRRKMTRAEFWRKKGRIQFDGH